ncbi:small RNA degrading nuclease 1-like isoform X3 [Ananas comosus]|uniref:Small RNA degrading nuclease 1-like isoform X3 n=1 Tax=Ananas comosus TaxID=4615 RepID=A0A6P5E9Y5_ANACO|nr:small RNA degrading nuclease 1-like isoform X3 [Ananas comosus]
MDKSWMTKHRNSDEYKKWSLNSQVLVEIVRFTQKQGLKGAVGGWKDFLTRYDKKFGSSLSDPAKRSKDILIAFLETFPQQFQKYFGKMVKRHYDRKTIEQYIKDYPDKESPEQRLVRLTMENPQHMQHYFFPSYNEGWKVMTIGKTSEVMNSKAMISIDCEMVLCQDGTESVVKVCAVDQNLEVKLNKVVNPNKAVADYRTHITGISAKDLEGVTCSLVDVQKNLRKLLSHGSILVGHSLYNDLHALKFDYPQVIDTSYIFKYMDLPTGASPSLNNLCKSVLGFAVREDGEPHNCLNDARAAMKLVLAKLEHGFDDPIEASGNNQTDVRVRGESYSTFVSFRNAAEANEAFKVLDGRESKDSCGRPQKHIFLKLSSGQTTSFYARKMTADAVFKKCDTSKKRAGEVENINSELEQAQDDTSESKRQRTCPHPCKHVTEIERLKQELREREDEIFHLQKILCTVAKKHGLQQKDCC